MKTMTNEQFKNYLDELITIEEEKIFNTLLDKSWAYINSGTESIFRDTEEYFSNNIIEKEYDNFIELLLNLDTKYKNEFLNLYIENIQNYLWNLFDAYEYDYDDDILMDEIKESLENIENELKEYNRL